MNTFIYLILGIWLLINLIARLKRRPKTEQQAYTPPEPPPTYRIAGFWLIVNGKKVCKSPPLIQGQTKNQIVTVGNTVMVNGFVYDPAKEKFIGWN